MRPSIVPLRARLELRLLSRVGGGRTLFGLDHRPGQGEDLVGEGIFGVGLRY